MLRVGFEPTPFRTRTLIWRLRPTRPSQLDEICSPVIFITQIHETLDPNTQPVTCNKFLLSNRPLGSYGTPTLPPLHSTQKNKENIQSGSVQGLQAAPDQGRTALVLRKSISRLLRTTSALKVIVGHL